MYLTRRRLLQSTASAAVTLSALGGFTSAAMAFSTDKFFEKSLLPEVYLGDENAPVVLTEYASMSCPFCKSFHEKVLPEIKKRYIDTGKVRYTIREFAFDPRASAAFMLARCVPKQNYYPMLDLLFASQASWVRAKDPAKVLLELSKRGGFTEETFNACLTNRELLGSLNAVKTRGEKEFGIRAVPTLFINGVQLKENLSVANVSRAIDKVLA